MTIHFSQLAPFIWAIAAILIIIIVVVVVKFFWQHILKFLLQGCAVIVAIIAVFILLHYLKIF